MVITIQRTISIIGLVATSIFSGSLIAQTPFTERGINAEFKLPERWYQSSTVGRIQDEKNQANINIVYKKSTSDPTNQMWLEQEWESFLRWYAEGYSISKGKSSNSTVQLGSGESVQVSYQSLTIYGNRRYTASINFSHEGKDVILFVYNTGKSKKLTKLIEKYIAPGISLL